MEDSVKYIRKIINSGIEGRKRIAELPGRIYRWTDRNILALGREMRLSYLPPLMVYLAAGVSGLTGIVGTFFVKDYLGLSAAFLAALGFWAGIPWALKMPLGHLVDLFWRWKSALVFLGAGLIAVSLLIVAGRGVDAAGCQGFNLSADLSHGTLNPCHFRCRRRPGNDSEGT